MKYFSEKTKKFYETEEACVEAEQKFDQAIQEEKDKKNKLAAERKKRAAELEQVAKNLMDARKHYDELVDAFIKDYGSYHISLYDKDDDDSYSLIDFFFNRLFK